MPADGTGEAGVRWRPIRYRRCMARRRRRRDRHAVALTTPPTSQTPTPPRPGRPEYRKVWAWVSIAVIPLLVGGAIALYSARLALDQAGEQEAHAQSGANRAEDADLARSPAVLARVRPTYSGPNWVWVFPQVLDEATVAELAGPSRQWFETEGARLSQEQIVAIGERATARIRELGGVLGAWGYVGQQRKSTTTHLVSLVGNRREKVRIVDIRARVLEKSPRLDGTLLLYLGEGVDDVEPGGRRPGRPVRPAHRHHGGRCHEAVAGHEEHVPGQGRGGRAGDHRAVGRPLLPVGA
jgi:hypothetical protein